MAADDRFSGALVKEYELMASSPREVFDFYKDRSENSDKYRWDGLVDEDTDVSLWARGEPLINLAIAQYGSNKEIAKKILRGESEPLRWALLKNWSGGRLFDDFPTCLFDGESDLAVFMNSCPKSELVAMFANPSIADSFICDLFEGKKIWNELDEDRQIFIVRSFAQNPRASTERDDSFMDGYAEYSYNRVFAAAWGLCAKVTPNHVWAISLSELTDKLLNEGFPFKDEEIMAVIARWYPSEKDVEDSKYDSEDHYKEAGGYLSSWQSVRQNLTKLIAGYSKHGNLAENPDIAIRCGFYKYGRFYIDEMKAAFDKDGAAAWQAMCSNANLWSNKEKRQALHDIAWEADKLDGRSNLDNANQFNAFYDRFKAQYPAMFKDDDDEEFESVAPDDEELPATKGYVFQLADTLQATNIANQARLDRLEKLLTSIAWAGAIALVFIAYKLS